jgi:hypothetical protein
MNSTFDGELHLPTSIPTETKASVSLYDKLSSSIVWAKIFKWEFWPFSVLYFPIFFYWGWLVLRTRSLFFFTSANPGIEFGGMLGESKKSIYDKIPAKYIPLTAKLSPETTWDKLESELKTMGLNLPIILKPDIGERGWMVELIKTKEDAQKYLNTIKVDFLVQEFIPYEVELGVFYYRYPNRVRGTVSSIVMKEMLNVIGDGHSSVRQLMKNNVRAAMQEESLSQKNRSLLDSIPNHGENVELVSIGNHCRGTTFLNGNHLINEKVVHLFNEIGSQIEGFYFGRYDLRCHTIEDLYEGTNFKILELNGAGAEPAHIYHPGYSLKQAYKDIIHHLKVLADISMINRKTGIRYMSFMEGMKMIKKIRYYNQIK